MSVLAGTNNLNDPNGQRRQISKCVQHPDYRNNDLESKDAAVCKVEIPFVFGSTVNSVELETAKIGAGTSCSITGWGSIFIWRDLPIPFYSEFAYPMDLRIGYTRTITNDECQSAYGE